MVNKRVGLSNLPFFARASHKNGYGMGIALCRMVPKRNHFLSFNFLSDSLSDKKLSDKT